MVNSHLFFSDKFLNFGHVDMGLSHCNSGPNIFALFDKVFENNLRQVTPRVYGANLLFVLPLRLKLDFISYK